nr:MAG TPA: hypothetical protein [Caudoviricetes sp.]
MDTRTYPILICLASFIVSMVSYHFFCVNINFDTSRPFFCFRC